MLACILEAGVQPTPKDLQNAMNLEDARKTWKCLSSHGCLDESMSQTVYLKALRRLLLDLLCSVLRQFPQLVNWPCGMENICSDWTLLHLVVCQDYLQSVKITEESLLQFLLVIGADANAVCTDWQTRQPEHKTALTLAIENRQMEVIQAFHKVWSTTDACHGRWRHLENSFVCGCDSVESGSDL